jgi:hypothetical protein
MLAVDGFMVSSIALNTTNTTMQLSLKEMATCNDSIKPSATCNYRDIKAIVTILSSHRQHAITVILKRFELDDNGTQKPEIPTASIIPTIIPCYPSIKSVF